MPRPFPVWSRGASRRRANTEHLLACPRVCPRWEIDALRALTKPQFKNAILHRPSVQTWPKNAGKIVNSLAAELGARLGIEVTFHLPDGGDYFLVARFPAADYEIAKAVAVALSHRMADLWFVLDRHLIRDGHFYRRDRRVRFTMAKTKSIHVPRPIR